MSEKTNNTLLNDAELKDVSGGLRTEGLASGATEKLMNENIAEGLTETLTEGGRIASTEGLASSELLTSASRIASTETLTSAERLRSTATEAATSKASLYI